MDKKQFIEQLSKLISFASLSHDQAINHQLLDYVESLISPKASIKRIVNKDAQILIASYQNDKRPDIAYLVHSDVVPGREAQFTLRQKGDKLFGRGVSDMKYSIPIGIALLNELIEKKSELSFSLVITTDEETGGFDGAQFLSQKAKFDPTALIVPDGGDNFKFISKSKGVCQLEVKASGRPAHASMPWQGDSALNKLVKLASVLLEKYEKNGSQESWETTLNIGQIKGGESTNQVCSQAVMKLDFRFPETSSKEEIKKIVESEADLIASDLQVNYISTGLPTQTKVSLPIVRKFIDSFADQLEKKIEIKAEYGASDARHFGPMNTPILMIKPTGGDIHGDDEWISLDACMHFYQGLRRFLELK